MTTIDTPFVIDGYGYNTFQPDKISTFNNVHEFATKAAAIAVVREIQSHIPEIGVLEICAEYAGNFCNVQRHGNRKDKEKDPLLEVLSIRRQGSPFLHNAGEIYNALTNGYTYPLDEFRAEAGI